MAESLAPGSFTLGHQTGDGPKRLAEDQFELIGVFEHAAFQFPGALKPECGLRGRGDEHALKTVGWVIGLRDFIAKDVDRVERDRLGGRYRNVDVWIPLSLYRGVSKFRGLWWGGDV